MWGQESRGGPGGATWEMRPVPACRSDSGTALPSVHSRSSHSISGATFTFPSCLLTSPPPAKCQWLSETCSYYLPNAYILFNPHESVSHLVVSNSATPWNAAHQGPLSMGLSRQEYWSRVPLPSPDLAYPFYISQFISADPKLPVRLTPMLHPLGNHRLLSVWECVSVSWTGLLVSYFRLNI